MVLPRVIPTFGSQQNKKDLQNIDRIAKFKKRRAIRAPNRAYDRRPSTSVSVGLSIIGPVNDTDDALDTSAFDARVTRDG